MLKVTVAEVERDVVKQLGINLSGSVGYGTAVVNFNNTNAFPINGTPSKFHCRLIQRGYGHVASHGTSRRGAHAGRADPHRDLW